MTIHVLRRLSILFLLLPGVLFVLYWFRPLLSCLVLPVWFFLTREEWKREVGNTEVLGWKALLTLLSGAVLWTYFSGVSGFGEPSPDQVIQQTKFWDLYHNEWPLFYKDAGTYPCYYFGYYLVPAFVSKLCGDFLAVAVFVWTVVGYFLGLCWIYLLLDRSWLLVIIFPFLRGADELLIVLAGIFDSAPVPYPAAHFQPVLVSLFTQSQFAPNQVIPALIITCIMLYDERNGGGVAGNFFLITLGFLWSVFAGIALLFLFFLLLAVQIFRTNSTCRPFLKTTYPVILWPGLAFIPIFFYLISSETTPLNGWLWDVPVKALRKNLISGYMSIFLPAVLLVLALSLWLTPRGRWRLLWPFLTVPLWLAAFSLYRVGFYNDWFRRASLPFTITILVFLLNRVSDAFHDRGWEFRKMCAGIAIAGMLVFEFCRNHQWVSNNYFVQYFSGGDYTFYRPRYGVFPDTYAGLKKMHTPLEVQQYLGSMDSFYARYLSAARLRSVARPDRSRSE